MLGLNVGLMGLAGRRRGGSSAITPVPMTFEVEEINEIDSNQALPISVSFTPLADSTGTIVFCAIRNATAPSDFTCTVNDQSAQLVNTYFETGWDNENQRIYCWYSDETSGPVEIDSATGFNNRVYIAAVKVAGGTIRSWTVFEHSHTLVGGENDAQTVAMPTVSYGDNDLVTYHVAGDDGGTLNPPALTEDADYVLAFGGLKGQLFVDTSETGGTVDPGYVTQGFRNGLAISAVAFSQLPAPTLNVTSPPVANFVYALNTARTEAVVPISGTYTQSPGAIEVRIIDDTTESTVVDWQDLDTSPSGGTFSGTVTVVAQGLNALRSECRVKNGDGTVFSQSDAWKVGLVIATYGQSNSLFWLSTQESAPSVSNGVIYDASAGEFRTLIGNGVANFINDLAASASLPILVIGGGQVGSTIAALSSGTTPFTDLEAAIDAYANGVLHGLVWNQGEGNTVTTLAATRATYAATLDTLHGDIVAITGQTKANVPLIYSSLATTGRSDGLVTDADWTDMRSVQIGMEDTYANMYHAGSAVDLIRLDTFHGYGLGYGRRGKREARVLAKALGYETGAELFEITAAAATNATTTTLTVTHGLGSDFTIEGGEHLSGSGALSSAGPNIPHFEVSVDGFTTPVACTAVRTNATTITLTHASISTSGRTFRYLYGMNPQVSDVIDLVLDDSAIQMPLMPVESMVAA